MFADDQGRRWSAAHVDDAVAFICITDARQSGRAIAADLEKLVESATDEILRAWLNTASWIGTLS